MRQKFVGNAGGSQFGESYENQISSRDQEKVKMDGNLMTEK